MSSSIFSSVSFFLVFFTFLSNVAQATVPPISTFVYVNEGDYGEYDTENGANYRILFQAPYFMLSFYNTTPGVYTLGLRMGGNSEGTRSNTMRWVWDANRGNPVGENATLTFGTDGNLVLSEADGKLVWQTSTANKGVVGLELLPTGNLVLLDSEGRFVWQSFHHPTDTLLVGQGLHRDGVKRLISKKSSVDGSEGRYSLVLETKRFAMYLKSENTPNPIIYYTPGDFPFQNSYINSVIFNSAPTGNGELAYELTYDYYYDNDTTPAPVRLVRPKYNTTLSFLRLEPDGNLVVYTFYDQVIRNSWDITYRLFNREGSRSVSECKLPSRCEDLGVCMNNQCVGCPTRKGLLWWNETCAAPTLPPCSKKSPSNVSYYKVVGVEHFTSDYTEGEGPTKVNECRGKCNNECGCLGFFYREESSKCFIAYELGTLTKVSNESHVAYIKEAM